jgi:transcriptional regulator with XRE-family HTH domain
MRQGQGWTRDRLVNECGVQLRTVQRRETGQDSHRETLSLVAEALRVSVRDLFSVIDHAEFGNGVDSFQERTKEHQSDRNRISGA